MITLLSGENTFERTLALRHVVAEYGSEVEYYDGSNITLATLPDLLMGVTLFSQHRMVVVRELSENKSVWNALADWLPRISTDIHVVFIETKPDKRTKTYKELVKIAKAQDFPAWTERDTSRVEQWVVKEAERLGFVIDKKSAQILVVRAGVEQWRLYHELEKLSVFDTITPGIIEQTVEASPTENVFNLFDAALRGDSVRVHDMIATLKLTEEPHMVFGLLSSQVFQLAALVYADKPTADVARDIGAHPFALSKLAPQAVKHKTSIKQIIIGFARADTALKSSTVDPWIEIELALANIHKS